MRQLFVYVFALFVFTSLNGAQTHQDASHEVLQPVEKPQYEKPNGVSHGVWQHVQGYLLPHDHPIKPALDEMFGSMRVLNNRASYMAAGFNYRERNRRRRLISKNPKLPGYLIKTYLDVHPLGKEDGLIWKHRIDGARQVQACIDHHKFNHIMKVPKKWLYPLPNKPAATGPYPKGFILVVEDMEILSHNANNEKYRTELTVEQMCAIYVVLKQNLLWDSIFPFNIPFCKDGKIAFIDTEFFNDDNHPLRLERMTEYFPPHLHSKWKRLIK